VSLPDRRTPVHTSDSGPLVVGLTVPVIPMAHQYLVTKPIDGVTRDIFEMYDAEAKPTEDPDQAIAAVVKVGDDQFILLNLTGEETARLH